jgi:subtilase family serine protease
VAAVFMVCVGLSPLAGASNARVVVASTLRAPSDLHPLALARTASVDVVLRPRHEMALESLTAALSDPTSPQYRKFLSERAFARRFGSSRATVRAFISYFNGFGLRATSTMRSGLVVHVEGSTTAIERAFAATARTARVNGVVTTAITTDATLPATLARQVSGIAGLNSWTHPNQFAERAPSVATSHARANVTEPSTCSSAAEIQATSSSGSFVASQQAEAYGLTSAWAAGNNASGETIGVYELAGAAPSDLTTFFNCYNLHPTINTYNVDGGPVSCVGVTDGNCDNSPDSVVEADLDVEEAGVLAPGATIDIYQSSNLVGSGPLDTYAAIANDDDASVVTTSWGACEAALSSAEIEAETTVFTQMATQGQTLLAASGDAGSSDCAGEISGDAQFNLAVDDPASQPLVTGVGGLTVNSITTNNTTLNEQVWNSGGGAGGGGKSAVWSRPSWQTGDGVPAGTQRMVPDLSVMADPTTSFIMYAPSQFNEVWARRFNSTWSNIGGTSVGAPLMAAVVATADGACDTRLGSINPTLYTMAANGTGFDDVTVGNNVLYPESDNPDNVGDSDWTATTGYDMASGLGSPNPTTFIADLCGDLPAPSTSSIAVPLTSVDVLNGASATVTIKNLSGTALSSVAPTIVATETGGTATATALSTTTNAQGQLTYEITASIPGTVTLQIHANGVALTPATVTFVTSAAVANTGLAPLGVATNTVATSLNNSVAVAVGVTTAGHLVADEAGKATVDLTAKLHLAAASGTPAIDCSNGSCVLVATIAGKLEAVANVFGSPVATNLGTLSPLGENVGSGTVALSDELAHGYWIASFLSSNGHLLTVQYRSANRSYTFTNLTAVLHLGLAQKQTSIVSTSLTQSYVAARFSGAYELIAVGHVTNVKNVTTTSHYSGTVSGTMASAPQLVLEPKGTLALLGRTSTSGLVVFTATTGAPTTLSAFAVIAISDVSAATFLAPPSGGASDAVLYLNGTVAELSAPAGQWPSHNLAALDPTAPNFNGISSGPVTFGLSGGEWHEVVA